MRSSFITLLAAVLVTLLFDICYAMPQLPPREIIKVSNLILFYLRFVSLLGLKSTFSPDRVLSVFVEFVSQRAHERGRSCYLF